MTQKELEEEPADIYEINLAIMALETKISNENSRRIERERQRQIRQGTG